MDWCSAWISNGKLGWLGMAGYHSQSQGSSQVGREVFGQDVLVVAGEEDQDAVEVDLHAVAMARVQTVIVLVVLSIEVLY